jgi:RNA recognition motif-containing protein
MQSTLVAVGGKGSNPKTTLYVGGLDEAVNESVLHAAFIPFGEIKVGTASVCCGSPVASLLALMLSRCSVFPAKNRT